MGEYGVMIPTVLAISMTILYVRDLEERCIYMQKKKRTNYENLDKNRILRFLFFLIQLGQ